jgi:two-component system, OmpR family, copper resistance phosphate regulon response regulator CusR
MRVLIVEDEPRIAGFLVKGLTACGYHVDHTVTGVEALRRLHDHEGYDLVLLDLGLPDVDGLDVLSRLRASGATLPVIVLSARMPAREEGLRRGADEFLVKPLAFSRLLERVRAMLPRRS